MKLQNILTFLFVALTFGTNAQNHLKRYDIKSGIVEYETIISGKIIGSTISGGGTEKLFFKDWGAIELKENEAYQTTTIKIFGKGKAETEHTHTINKLDNGKSYTVDFDNEQIYASKEMTMDITSAFQSDSDVGKTGESMLKSMGGRKIGSDKLLGYNCDVWELSGGKQWIHKGVMLKIEMTMLGVKTITQAKTADFNLSVADKFFKLPNFPIQQEEGFLDDEDYKEEMEDLDANMEKMSKMSFAEWKKLVQKNDEEMEQMSDAELHRTYDMMQKMIKLRQGN